MLKSKNLDEKKQRILKRIEKMKVYFGLHEINSIYEITRQMLLMLNKDNAYIVRREMNWFINNFCEISDLFSDSSVPPIGVYLIKNKLNGMIYVGATKHLHLRWIQHYDLLSYKKHYNKQLQDDFNVFGYDAFSFEIIELFQYDFPVGDVFCHEYYLKAMEGYHIETMDAINPKFGYNSRKIPWRKMYQYIGQYIVNKMQIANINLS